MSIELTMPSNHLILCCPVLLLSSILPSIRVFSNESALHIMWPKYWSFSFSISPSSEYSGLISFRTALISLLSKRPSSLVQHHSSKVSILRCSAFFVVQLSHPYMTTGKTIALTRQIFVSKVMSLLFNRLSRFVTAFFPRRKYLLISWLKSPTTVILEPKKMKSTTASPFSPSICHEMMGPDLCNSIKLWAHHAGPPKKKSHGGKLWQNMIYWRREWQTTSVFLPQELHEQYEKAKRYNWKMSPLGRYMSNMLLQKSRKIAPERMKRLGQSRNDAKFWMCLVVKVKSDAVKNTG